MLACSGIVSNPAGEHAGPTTTSTGSSTSGTTGTTTGAGGAGGSVGGGDPTSTVLPARIRRLTDAEFDRLVKALLGTQKTPARASFPIPAKQGSR